MMATVQYDQDARKRRRRQHGLLLALFAALLATAISADRLSFGESQAPGQAASPVSRALPRAFARSAGRKHGVTMPIGRPALLAGRGGPANPGDWIDEDGGSRRWFLDGGHHPIDGFARTPFALPTRRFGSFSTPVGGFRGFPGGAGGGSGGGGGDIRIIPKETPAPEPVTGGDDEPKGEEVAIFDPGPRILTDPPSQFGKGSGSSPGTIVDVVGTPGTSGLQSLTSQEPSAPAALVPVSAVPEPDNWMMMIVGFLLAGLAIRRRQARHCPAAAAARL